MPGGERVRTNNNKRGRNENEQTAQNNFAKLIGQCEWLPAEEVIEEEKSQRMGRQTAIQTINFILME